MIRVALIAGTYQPTHCGVADYTAQLRQGLADHSIETLVLTTIYAAQHNEDANVQGIVDDWGISSLIPLVRAVQTCGADLLHIQHAAGTYRFERSIFLLPLLLRWSGWRKPIITTVHEYGWWEWHPPLIPKTWLEWLKEWGQQRSWWDREDGFLLTQSNAVITTNTSAEMVIQQRLPYLQARLFRIPIGANVPPSSVSRDRARQQLLHRYSWPAESQIIAFFGFLHPVKGLETLLAAFSRLIEQHSSARLLLMGGVESLALPDQQAATYWNQLQQQISQLGLEEVVQMTGYLEADQVSALLSGADLGVLPFNPGVTLKSGSLLTLIGHGLPVVATRAHPPDPDLEDLPFLRLVAPRQPQELARQLAMLLQEANSSITERQTWSQQFSWTGIAQRHVQIYQQVLAH
jgi:polysaccharide biosynthesis protein PslF